MCAMGDMERVASCGRHLARDKQMGGARIVDAWQLVRREGCGKLWWNAGCGKLWRHARAGCQTAGAVAHARRPSKET